MAKNIRSIDPSMRLWGQLGLALFFASTVTSTAQAQVTWLAESEQSASAGFMKPGHWLGQSLSHGQRSQWLAQQATIGAQYQWDNWRVGLTRDQRGYAQANSNAWLAAAQNEAKHEVDLRTVGNFNLQAEVWTLDATTLSAAYKWRLSETFSVEPQPFLQTIHDFQHMRGNLALINSSSSLLTGQIQKTGTRQYGYLTKDQPDQGWGAGLDIGAQWLGSWGKWGLTVKNAWHQLQFSAIHQMSRDYAVTAEGNKINIADLPSVTGQYTLTQGSARLPAFWQLIHEPSPLPGLSVGALGLGQQTAWTAGYSQAWSTGRWSIQTVQARNWTVGYGWSWGSGWKASGSVSVNEQGKGPLLSSFMLRKAW